MTDGTPNIYLDANVILAYIANENNRADDVESIFRDAQNSQIKLLTSSVSITEVAYIKEAKDAANNNADEARIDQLWTPLSPITVVDFSIEIAKRARSVIRKARTMRIRSVRSIDAIHLASAEVFSCKQFFTYERETTRQGWNQLISAEVSEPVK